MGKGMQLILFLAMFALGYFAGWSRPAYTGGYTEGYADGRSQAHQDVVDYCEYRREKEWE